jgi:hypothetical protein
MAVMIKTNWAFATLLLSCAGVYAADDSTYTFYRNSVTAEGMRLHIATFDTTEGEAYNRSNCEQARELFQAQPGVKTKFWCEKGAVSKIGPEKETGGVSAPCVPTYFRRYIMTS